LPPSFAKASAGGRSAYGGLANEIFVLGALASLEGTCAYCGLGGASPCRRRLNERKNPAWNAGLNMDSVSYPTAPAAGRVELLLDTQHRRYREIQSPSFTFLSFTQSWLSLYVVYCPACPDRCLEPVQHRFGRWHGWLKKRFFSIDQRYFAKYSATN